MLDSEKRSKIKYENLEVAYGKVLMKIDIKIMAYQRNDNTSTPEVFFKNESK